MKLIIAGGRDFDDYELLKRECIRLLGEHNITHVISGMARGADSLGVKFAEGWNIDILKFPANWNKFGKSAGYIRNEEMAKNGDILIAFWDKKSKGTNHMINLAKKYNLIVKIVEY
jgi:hypothetical protein